ncbi:MAG TPA: nucleoside monophosphate kinase [Candidatus Bathyarchaeia archaeon]|nr:nucleoside monophosphate kinase [Candidatus Bathyarchaeia archaeon]
MEKREHTPISTDQLEKIKKWLGTGAINIFGPPYAGKDTHGHELAQLFNAPLLGGGDILRNMELPPEIKEINEAGLLPPSDFYLQTVTPYLSKDEFAGQPLILSSVGRWIGEEQGIIKAAEAAGHPIKAVLYLHLGNDLVHTRFEKSKELGDRGDRADDEAHKLETRLNEFNTKTLPVIDVYRHMDLLIEIDSDASSEEVLKSILARLFLFASSTQ